MSGCTPMMAAPEETEETVEMEVIVEDAQESSFIKHAKQEFEYAGWNKIDDETGQEMQNLIMENLLEILEVISKQGHSGFSIGYLKDCLNKLIDFKPLTPLQGTDDEWNNKISQGHIYQNNRCPSIFKDSKTGEASDIYGYIFRDSEGSTYTNGFSHKTITFPYIVPSKPPILDVEYLPDDCERELYERVHKEAIQRYEESKASK